MSFESSLDSNCEWAIPAISLVKGVGVLSECLSSRRSLDKEENLGPILRTAQLDANLASGFMHATDVGESSNLRSSAVHEAVVSISNLPFPNGSYLPSNGTNDLEPCTTLPCSCLPFSINKPVNVSLADETVSPLDQGGPGRKRQQMENSTASTNLSRSELHACLESLPVRIKKEPGTPVQMLKKPRIDVNRENIPHQLTVQELFFKGLQECNPQLKKMTDQQREKNQKHQLILPSVPHLRRVQMQVPKQRMRNMLQDLGNKVSFGTLIDSSLCSRRLMQYLYHLRNRPHDNNIVYWKKFVSEYYAPDSYKRWCLSTYSDDKRHVAGVFYPKPMKPWCCEICSSRSGKGLEVAFEVLPRLFKTKFDSGVLDEILFLDLPRAYLKVPPGLLVLEYRKVTQESIYENFRVVHEGRLQIIFRWDLKILSWEFCVQNHEEYLLRSLVASQVDQLACSAEKYQNDIQNGVSMSASSEGFRANFDRFVVAGHQLAKSMDFSMMNDGLGYPKTFTRLLQIAEVLNSMKDLMAFSTERKMGPIESLNNYVQSCKTMDQLEKQGMRLFAAPQNQPIGHEHHSNAYGCRETDNELVSGPAKSTLDFAEFNHRLFRRNASIASMRRKGVDSYFADPSIRSTCYDSHLIPRLHTDLPPCNLPRSPSELGKNYHQHLIDKMLQEMVAANRGMNLQYANEKINNETARSWPSDKSAKNNRLHSTERSNAASDQRDLANASRIDTIPRGSLQTFSGGTNVETDSRSPF